jgi:hypothetical protein
MNDAKAAQVLSVAFVQSTRAAKAATTPAIATILSSALTVTPIGFDLKRWDFPSRGIVKSDGTQPTAKQQRQVKQGRSSRRCKNKAPQSLQSSLNISWPEL